MGRENPSVGQRALFSANNASARLRQRSHRAGGNSAIHQQSLASDVAAGLSREEHNRRVEIMRLTRAFERNALAKIFHPLFILVENLVLIGAEPAGSETVDGNSISSP